VRFDHHSDGTVDGSLYVYSVGEQFSYDPRSVDYALAWYAGSFTLGYQVVDYDASYNPTPGEWQAYTFTLEQPSEIEVQDDYGYTAIYDGMSSVEFGSTATGFPISRSFTIYNYGYGVLSLDAASLSIPDGFSLAGSFPTEIAPSSSASFTLQLDATTAGSVGGNVSFGTNDSDENPFDFAVGGQVNAPVAEIEVQDDYGYTSLYDGMSTVDFGSTSEGAPLSRSFTIYNYGDGTLTLAPVSLPAGFSLVGTFPGSVMPYSSASFTLQLDATTAGSVGGNVSFGTNDSDENPFDFMVMAQVMGDPSANLAPTLDPIPNLSAIDEDAGQQVVLLMGITAGAGESQNLTVTAASGNSLLLASLSVAYTSPNPSGTLSFTPAANQSGTALVTVTVRDDGGTANGGVDAFEQTFLVTVSPVNDAPFLVDPIAAIEVAENSIMTVVGLDWYFGDVDIATSGDALDYSVAVNPGDPNDPEYDSDLLVASIVDRGLRLEYAPGRTGHVDVTVRASDLAGLWAETTVRVTVTPVGNSAPVVVGALEDLSVEVGQPDIVIDLAGVFADPDVLAGTDSLAYAVTNSAPGVLSETLSGSVLTLSLLPGGLGTAQFTVRATDTEGAYAETSFSATVLPFNNPPLASLIPPVVVDEDAADLVLGLRDFFSDAEDPDEAIVLDVALSSISSPDLVVATLNELTGELTLAFLQDGSGTAEYAVTARDSGGKTATATLAVTVNPVNDAPTGPVGLIELPLEVSPSETVVDLWEYFYDVEDGWDLTYEIVADSITNPALFEGTPYVDTDDYLRLYAAAGASGASDLTIRATDADGAATLGTLTFAIAPATGGGPAPLPIVSIVDLKHTGENAPAAGFFVVQALGEFTGTLQVPFTLGGSADPDTDYATDAATSGMIELSAPGDSVTISVTALDDADIDGPKSVTLSLQGGSTYQVGEGVGNTVWVNDDDNGAVVYVAHAKSTWEGATGDDEGAFVIEAIGSLSFALDPMYSDYTGPVPPPGGFTWGLYGPPVDLTTLQVPYQFSGSATWGDYASPDGTGTVTITSPGSATVRIVAVPDESPEGNEDVTLELLLDPDPEPGPGEPASKYTYFNPVYAGDQWAGCLQVGTYALGSPGSAAVTIKDECRVCWWRREKQGTVADIDSHVEGTPVREAVNWWRERTNSQWAVFDAVPLFENDVSSLGVFTTTNSAEFVRHGQTIPVGGWKGVGALFAISADICGTCEVIVEEWDTKREINVSGVWLLANNFPDLNEGPIGPSSAHSYVKYATIANTTPSNPAPPHPPCTRRVFIVDMPHVWAIGDPVRLSAKQKITIVDSITGEIRGTCTQKFVLGIDPATSTAFFRLEGGSSTKGL